MDQVMFEWLSDCSCNFSLVVEFQGWLPKVHLYYGVLSFLINEAKHSTLNWQRCIGYGPSYVRVALRLQLQFQFGCGVSRLIAKSTFVLWSFKLFDKWSKTLNLKLTKMHWLWTKLRLSGSPIAAAISIQLWSFMCSKENNFRLWGLNQK